MRHAQEVLLSENRRLIRLVEAKDRNIAELRAANDILKMQLEHAELVAELAAIQARLELVEAEAEMWKVQADRWHNIMLLLFDNQHQLSIENDSLRNLVAAYDPPVDQNVVHDYTESLEAIDLSAMRGEEVRPVGTSYGSFCARTGVLSIRAQDPSETVWTGGDEIRLHYSLYTTGSRSIQAAATFEEDDFYPGTMVRPGRRESITTTVPAGESLLLNVRLVEVDDPNYVTRTLDVVNKVLALDRLAGGTLGVSKPAHILVYAASLIKDRNDNLGEKVLAFPPEYLNLLAELGSETLPMTFSGTDFGNDYRYQIRFELSAKSGRC